MEHHKLVLPEHLNHYGFLFGGYLLKWVDEVAWIAASLDYPGCHFVTVGLDEVAFHRSVREGAILRFETERTNAGNTSVTYRLIVCLENAQIAEPMFQTCVTLVRVNSEGKKQALNS